jgi:saccharopine dehydrogenase (NAD+, L-lysine-forming)
VVQLGCGITGLVCAEILEKHPKVSEIVLADSKLEFPKALSARVKSDKMSVVKVDATKTDDLKKLMKGADLLIGSLPYVLSKKVLDVCAETGTNYEEFSLCVEGMEEFEETDKMCEKAGITALTAMGEDPGISDCFAVNGASKLDELMEAHVMDGDSGTAEEYDFFSLWSPVGMLEETTVPAAVCRDGKIEFVPPLHEKEIYEFPKPIGKLPVYKTSHEETYLMPKFIKGLKNADFRIAVDDNFAYTMKWIRKLGMHSLKPMDVKGVKVAPLDVVIALMPQPVDLIGKVKGFAAVVVEVIGKKNGKKTMVKTWAMMSHEKAYEICKSNATGYLVGAGGAVSAELFLEGHVKKKGFVVPEQMPNEKFMARLPTKQIEVRQEVKVL